MTDQSILQRFDEWLAEESPFAALVMRQWLMPVEGKDAVIFPPTYTLDRTDVGSRFSKGEQVPGVYQGAKGPYGYNIDLFQDGTSVCLIDSVGSQANRMEPIFLREPYCKLVPQVRIRAGDKEVNLLQAGHRAADAIVRFSDLAGELERAFRAIGETGNAEPLAKIAPTSIVFGVWDSRLTQVKLPRIVRSVIRAYDVRPLHRSAQYIPPVDYVGQHLLDPPEGQPQKEAMSEQGLAHAPAAWTHGGVQVLKEIRREAALNLTAIRTLGASDRGQRLQKLRRYILGLALVAFTAPQEPFLREGCQLVPDPDRPPLWELVRYDGTRTSCQIAHKDALEYAELAAQDFGVGEDRIGTFDAETARSALGQSKAERKETRRRRQSTAEEEGN
ncbi:MAG: type I-U CRISPR-associated RAMP protein Csb1/Cas7u [Thermoguttaceae bacterium]|nr:type I-U CRISPR-associated RAMP protein Csb1/Cas7u [Thermoguttaceae bacterium]MDW8037572.1 type I-U CRISPR-associated RAMP protein Csb1/Cas7u [Thermoguttaceae bacterium]